MSNIRCQKALSLAYLQPKEESFGASFKFKHKNMACGALIDLLELTVIGENDQVLLKGTMKICVYIATNIPHISSGVYI